MAGLALFDGKERWMVLSSDDHTLRAFKKRGDAHAVVEVAAAGAEIARRFDVMASSYAIAVRRGGGAQPHELVLGGVAVACDWWAALSQHFALAGDATPLAALSATHANTRTPNKFYAAFAAKNWREMAECYSDAAVFSDRVFKNLDALHVRKMWEMLLTGAKGARATTTDGRRTDDGRTTPPRLAFVTKCARARHRRRQISM